MPQLLRLLIVLSIATLGYAQTGQAPGLYGSTPPYGPFDHMADGDVFAPDGFAQAANLEIHSDGNGGYEVEFHAVLSHNGLNGLFVNAPGGPPLPLGPENCNFFESGYYHYYEFAPPGTITDPPTLHLFRYLASHYRMIARVPFPNDPSLLGLSLDLTFSGVHYDPVSTQLAVSSRDITLHF